MLAGAVAAASRSSPLPFRYAGGTDDRGAITRMMKLSYSSPDDARTATR